MKTLFVGYRGGWPGTALEKITAHAVYKLVDPELVAGQKAVAVMVSAVDADLGVALFKKATGQNGLVRGYGLVGGKGQIVDDATAAPAGIQYTWLEPTIALSDAVARDFETCAVYQAGQVTYTGIGGNCFTAVVKALDDLQGLLADERGPGWQANIQAIRRLLTQLGGLNLGMGTKITNESLLGASVMQTVQTAVQTRVVKVKKD